MGNNDWVQFYGKKIIVRQKDAFKKFGTLEGETESHIILKFETGNIHFIAKDFINTLDIDTKVIKLEKEDGK